MVQETLKANKEGTLEVAVGAALGEAQKAICLKTQSIG